MYLLAHLLAGVMIGLILFSLFHDRLVILVCAIGSILPDLIDKPTGYYILSAAHYGRIYSHTLLFIGLVLFAGMAISLRYKRAGILTLALAAGLLSHHFLDALWRNRVTWYWPVFGPFRGNVSEDFFWKALLGEITNPGEWVAGIMLLSVILVVAFRRDRVSGLLSKIPDPPSFLVILIACSMVILGAVIMAGGGIG